MAAEWLFEEPCGLFSFYLTIHPDFCPEQTQEKEYVGIVWDDSNMRSVYADVSSVTVTREEIVLLFGEGRIGYPGQREVRAQLCERVILSPTAAKRLAIQLQTRIQDHESNYGVLDVTSPPSAGRVSVTSARRVRPFSETSSADKKAGQLFQWVRDLNVEVGLERSVKISKNTLLPNRFLLGMGKRAMGQDADVRILDISKRMGMPENFLESFRENLSEASYVHFGFEQNEATSLYKAYLEFYEKIEKEISNQPNQPSPFLLHLGYKWDASDNAKGAVTRYNWYYLLSVDAIMARFSYILDPHRHRKLLEIANGIVSLASARIPCQDILYLEVTEENNPRISFDINMYRAHIQLEELYPFLLNICRHYSISSEEFHILYDRFKNKTFGHLSGGIDREGKERS